MAGHEIICGGFRIGRQIGVGGQALVCEAECVEDRYGFVPVGSSVALKVARIQQPPDQPNYEDEQSWNRLLRRVDGLKRLDHPNVVRYYGCFSEIADLGGMDGVCRVHVIVMELLKGTNLKDWLVRCEHGGKPTGLDADDALSVIRASVAGLSYTSRLGLVHRDIKPANIFVCEDGTVKIIDFGLAAQENVTQTTNVGGLKGTLNYMAPEFTEEYFCGDETSDVFSMGVVMHQLITGNLPYDALTGKDGGETLVSYFSRWMSVKNGGPSPVLVWPIVSRLLIGIAPVVAKALAPAREARYATFAELERALARVECCEVENGRRRYRYLRMVGKGGFGEVFKARDLSTGALVAVKRLFNMSSAARFEREAKTLKLLQDQDRCFVRFVDFFVRAGSGVSDREAFLVMEYLDGMPGNSLREAINAAAQTPSGRLDKLAVLLVFERYARGLAMMHGNGIIHRDIKPSNLYFADGRPERAAILDFGIVRDLNAEQTTGNVPCTLDYAPPEIILDRQERGRAGMDIYALGLCLYEALTGKLGYERLPAGVPGYVQFVQRVQNKVRPKFADPLIQQNRKLRKLLDAMTALDPVQRLSSAEAVAQALREIIDGLEHLGDVTVPLDREAARKMWAKHHPRDDSPKPLIPRPKPSDGRLRSRRWIWLPLLGLASVCAAYFGPTHGPQLLKALQSHFVHPDADETPAPSKEPPWGGALLASPEEDGETPVPAPISVPSNPPPTPVVVTNRLVITNVVSRPPPAPVVITNVIERPANPPPAPPSPPPEVKIRVTVPQLASDVKCYFNDEIRKQGATFTVRPGEYDVAYRRFGYKTQEIAFAVRKENPETALPMPSDWEAEPVSVGLPSLDEGVTCRVDGKAFSSGQGLLPGRHTYRYERKNYLSQDGEFPVSPGVERRLPPPGKWEPASKPVPPPQVLNDALFNYDNEEFYDAVRCFAEAVKGGYRLTDDDLRRVKHAYNTTLKKLGVLMENIEHDMSLGRTPIRPLKEVQDERKNLLAWRRIIESEK